MQQLKVDREDVHKMHILTLLIAQSQGSDGNPRHTGIEVATIPTAGTKSPLRVLLGPYGVELAAKCSEATGVMERREPG